MNINTVGRYIPRDDRFKTFAEHFKHQLKMFHVCFKNEFEFDSMKLLSEFENLEYLYCDFSFQNESNSIELLKLIGLKCKRLRVLDIQQLDSPLNDVFDNRFNLIKKLILKGCKANENFNFLSHCHNLTHLVLEKYQTDGSDFEDIHIYLPQLKSIDVTIFDIDTKFYMVKIMKHLEKLTNLCELKIGCALLSMRQSWFGYRGISFESVISFIDNNVSIRSIGIYPDYSFQIRPNNYSLIPLYLIRARNYIKKRNRRIIINIVNWRAWPHSYILVINNIGEPFLTHTF